jgi:poly[(R)-3-hydroxyalkanoate] polymerase subunit PhaC
MTATTSDGVPVDLTAAADQAAPLDALLVDAALGPFRRFTPNASSARWVVRLATRPQTTGRRLGDLVGQLTRIGVGSTVAAPSRRDRRFADPAWSENPLLRRVVQAYLAAGQTAEQLIADARLDWRDELRVRFLVENVVEALSPSNVPLLNPSSAKAAIDTAGISFARGGRNSSATLRPRPARRPWSILPRSRWAAPWPSARDLSCCARRCSS